MMRLSSCCDEQNGGFLITGSDSEALVSRPKDIMDNATRLATVLLPMVVAPERFPGEEDYRRRAGTTCALC